MAQPYVVREATLTDIPEIVRLRVVMLDALGFGSDDTSWHSTTAAWLREGFAAGRVTAFVAEADSRVVGGGIGILEPRVPGPGNGLYGYIMSMATDPDWRGRGVAAAVVEGLLAWFRERGVHAVDLHASKQGEPVYRALGFTENPYTALRWSASD
jgi:GNAT superfamily N-acetyltransferase